MEDSARLFMNTTGRERGEAYWNCYLQQTRHGLEASKQHERCVALEHNIGMEFAQALKTTSVIAARLGALISFARDKGYKLPDNAKELEETGLKLSGERFLYARKIEKEVSKKAGAM